MVRVLVTGKQALWCNPHLRGDAFTYPFPTPSAAMRVLASIFKKPEMEWEVPRIDICAPIIYDTVQHRHIKGELESLCEPRLDKNRTIATNTILANVVYVIHGTAVANYLRTPRTGASYELEFTRRLRQGRQHSTPYLGHREFVADCTLLEEDEAGPLPIPVDLPPFRMLFNNIPIDLSRDEFESVYFTAHLKGGVLQVSPGLYAKYRDRLFHTRDTYHAPSRLELGEPC